MDKQFFIENVCEKCPGSLWGQKSICRVHNQSIGQISECLEWEQQEHSPKNQEGQLAFFDLEPAIEIIQMVEEDLKDYHWMVKEIERLERYLDQAITLSTGSSGLVSQYGIEATLPKGKGLKLSELKITEEKYERQWRRLEKLRKKISLIDQAVYSINDEKERTVLECILDGERMNVIAKHVGVSRQRLNEIKRKVVKKVAWKIHDAELKGA